MSGEERLGWGRYSDFGKDILGVLSFTKKLTGVFFGLHSGPLIFVCICLVGERAWGGGGGSNNLASLVPLR